MPAPCWICLEEGPDDHGKPLMRGCSCRGDSAGFAHVACIAGFARRKSDEAYDGAMKTGQLHKLEASNIPWMDCPTCKQQFRGETALAVAKARLKLNEETGIPESDYRSISTCFLLDNAHRDVGNFIGAKEIEEKCLEILRSNPELPYSPPLRLEMLASLMRTHIHFGDDEAILDCLYERRDVASSHHSLALRVASIELEIKAMESKMTGKICEPVVTASFLRGRFESAQREHGKQSDLTLTAILPYAISLVREGRVLESLDLLDEGLKDAKRALGPDHSTTKLLETRLHQIQAQYRTAKLVSENSSLNSKNVNVLRATKDGGKYIIAFDEKGEMKKVKVPLSKLMLPKDTAVVCQGLVSAQHLNGLRGKIKSFDKEKGRYSVAFEGDDSSSLVKPANLAVVFD